MRHVPSNLAVLLVDDGKRQAVVLELAAGEFTRIILSANHGRAHPPGLKLTAAPDPSAD